MTVETSVQPGAPLEEFTELSDAYFAQEWKARFQKTRLQMLPDYARWLRILRFIHPRQMRDHWQDSRGLPMAKLANSKGKTLIIANMCRSIIEVYASLLGGQKPMPFGLDVEPTDATSPAEMFRADAQEKVLLDQLDYSNTSLKFLDSCVSTVAFGIGWAYAKLDHKTRMLKVEAPSWPGDVLPIWSSDRYGRDSDALEAVMMVERITAETAARRYGDQYEWVGAIPDMAMRPDASYLVGSASEKMVMILYTWYRWADEDGKESVGYGEIAIEGCRKRGTNTTDPSTLYRENDTEYPDIPVRWASRFQTPGEAPHRAAGVIDNVCGINAEYNEKFSALADALMKTAFPQMKAKGFTSKNMPTPPDGSNVIPMGSQQDLAPVMEIVIAQGWDAFLNRMETWMLTEAGLSRLMMGALPPGETSGEALQNLLHAAIARLEVVRSPIQAMWLSLFTDVCVPILRRWGHYNVDGDKVDLREIFAGRPRIRWIWPDVTPRDALRAAELAMNLGRGGWLSDESVMSRASIPSVVDELAKIKKQKQDVILHPNDVRETAMAKSTLAAAAAELAPTGFSPIPQENPQGGFEGFQPGGFQPRQQMDAMAKTNRQAQDARVQSEARRTPQLSQEDNAVPPGSPANAAQGVRSRVPPPKPTRRKGR